MHESESAARSPFAFATDRIALTPMARDECDALHALFREAQVRRYLWDDEIIPRATVEAVIEASQESFRTARFGHWTLRLHGGDDVVGFCGLRPIDAGPETELLYALHPRHWGAGLAREASRAVLRHAFDALGMARVAGRVDTPNRASVRVLEALGMAFEGERMVAGRPTLHYALAREVWAAARPPAGT